MKQWSRRKFLGAGVVSSIALSSATAANYSSAIDSESPQNRGTAAASPANDKNVLTAVMDEMIPATDGMPLASEVGGVDYLEKLATHDSKVAKAIRQSLTAIENLSQTHSRASFIKLSPENKIAILNAFESQDSGNFKILLDSVYEAYYEQSRVWKLIDYTCYETNGGGPTPKPFNEEILSEVRKKPKYYREA